MCRLVFSSIVEGDEIEGLAKLWFGVDDKITTNETHEAREVREVRIRGAYRHDSSFGSIRVYADEGIERSELRTDYSEFANMWKDSMPHDSLQTGEHHLRTCRRLVWTNYKDGLSTVT